MRSLALSTTAICLIGAPGMAAAMTNQNMASVSADRRTEIVIVTAGFPRARNEMLSGTNVLDQTNIDAQLRTTIGETLARQAGVSATSFGPNASRPVLRGLQGERVRVLSDGIGSFDVSNTSVDHAVIINPITAQRIEVLRGPAALLFGSSAIGGAVNVIQDRIPREVPEQTTKASLLAQLGSAGSETSLAAGLDVRLGDRLVAHFDGTFTKSDDLRIGGFVLAPDLREQALDSNVAEIAELADLSKQLPNSQSETQELAFGIGYISDRLNLGISVARYDGLYGIPVRYSLDPDIEAEAVSLDIEQTRVDVRGEFTPQNGAFEQIKLRGGYADYRHDEVEETGEIATTFLNEASEARLEMIQRAQGSWRGVLGAQGFVREFSVDGAEKFLPASKVQQWGLFTLQSFDLGQVRTELGLRVEQTQLDAQADTDLGNPDLDRDFTTFAGSLGGSVGLSAGWRVGINASYTQRAPSAEELFANGPHAGTQAFEVGNPDFEREAALGLEATLSGRTQRLSVTASVFYNDFDGFIFERPTGEIEDDLPVFQFEQVDARHYGGEIEISYDLATLGPYAISLDAMADATRAELKNNGGNVPRIPAFRLLGGIEATSDMVDLRGEVEWVGEQDEIAAFETTTKGYSLVNLTAVFRPFGRARQTSVTLGVNNVFDQSARRHASFLKDYAPLAGRDVRLTVRMGF